MNNEEKIENMKSVVNGSMRRKLYFNPAYFEPQLLEVSIAYKPNCSNQFSNYD